MASVDLANKATMQSSALASSGIELWGGFECSLVRVQDRYMDELALTGHLDRVEGDIALAASLGIRKLRVALHWERAQPEAGGPINFDYADRCLAACQMHGIEPIVGLVHHGSGPAYTSLIDPGFAQGLAGYAAAVADRYPHINYYTPVNEPLTTARFACLYGVWYPHARYDDAMIAALLHQIEAVQLCMAAIRKVQPNGVLVQTEDLGYTHSTPMLAYQAAFENDRRWLTFDLLLGQVAPGHKLYKFLTQTKGAAAQLRGIRARARARGPMLLGINHYITSERYLDQRLSRYPAHTHGGNANHRYADVEAVRAPTARRLGIEVLLSQAWERYQTPLAITEWHIGCTREEQLRWMDKGWQAVCAAQASGVDVQGFTPWALVGSVDWNSLLTRQEGYYETGPFDIRGPVLQESVVSRFIQARFVPDDHSCHLLAGPAWWHRPLPADSTMPETKRPLAPILITGATGTLGQALARACQQRGLAHVLTSRAQLDITDQASINSALQVYKPWAVINTAGYVRVDEAQHPDQMARCYAENTMGAANLAHACQETGIRLVQISTDLVFDGLKGAPYLETDQPRPLNQYGSTKAEAERLVATLCPSALIIRTSAFFSPADHHNFVWHALKDALEGRPVHLADDEWVSPTYVPALCHALLDHLIDGTQGLLHLACTGADTWAGLARRVCRLAGLDAYHIEGVPGASLGLAATRPTYTALASDRWTGMPTLERCLAQCVHHLLPQVQAVVERMAENKVEVLA